MRTRLLTLTVAVLLPLSSFGSPPRVFFTDLQSGPNTGGENGDGTILTLYGKRFGAAQGTSTVTVGGVAVARYLQWGAVGAGGLEIQRISVALGGTAASGSVVVHTANGDSNADVTFTVRPGNIHCVATNGSDNDTGDFPNHCWGTLVQAKSAMVAGDITYALDGVSQTAIDNYSSSFSISVGGAAGSPLAVVAYPGATVTIGADSVELGIRTPNISGAFDHWVLAGLVMRGQSALTLGWTDFRIVGNDISCTGTNQWGCVQPYGDSQSYLGNFIHDTGQGCGSNPNTCKLYHAVYFGVSNHDEFAWNVVDPDPSHTGVAGCRAIQFHTTDNSGLDDYDLHIHDNLIRNAICDGLNLVTVNPDLGPVEVYNNVIYHVGTGPAPAGVESDYACLYTAASGAPTQAVDVYNNTFYDCGSRGNSSSGAFTSDIPTRLRNNIVVALSQSEPYVSGGSTACSAITGSNNNFMGAGGSPSCAVLSASLGVDPGFLNAAGFDFHLTANSPARNAGVAVPSLATDLDGVARPQGNAFSLGAYEFDTGYTPPADAGTGAAPDAGRAVGDAGAGGPAPDGGSNGTSKGGCGCDGSGPGDALPALALLISALARASRRRAARRGTGKAEGAGTAPAE